MNVSARIVCEQNVLNVSAGVEIREKSRHNPNIRKHFQNKHKHTIYRSIFSKSLKARTSKLVI